MKQTKQKEVDQIMGTAMLEKTEERYCTVQESIIDSFTEVKLMREGKLPKRSWDDFVQRMKDEMEEDD